MSFEINMTLKDKLDLLVEECAEIIQAVQKIRRFGAHSEYKGKTNVERLEQEMGDALCAIKLLMFEYSITNAGLATAQANKRKKLLGLYGRKKNLRSPKCKLVFKDPLCGYRGGVKQCNKTPSNCKALGNFHRFGGWPYCY